MFASFKENDTHLRARILLPNRFFHIIELMHFNISLGFLFTDCLSNGVEWTTGKNTSQRFQQSYIDLLAAYKIGFVSSVLLKVWTHPLFVDVSDSVTIDLFFLLGLNDRNDGT